MLPKLAVFFFFFLHMIAITVEKAWAKAYVWTLEKKKDMKKVQLHSQLL